MALFTAGFFADGLQQRTVGLDYYVNMGGGAYRTLATDTATTARARALSEVFAELAAKFLDLVDVLNEVRISAGGCRDHDVLRLYETWLRTRQPARRPPAARGGRPAHRDRRAGLPALSCARAAA